MYLRARDILWAHDTFQYGPKVQTREYIVYGQKPIEGLDRQALFRFEIFKKKPVREKNILSFSFPKARENSMKRFLITPPPPRARPRPSSLGTHT